MGLDTRYIPIEYFHISHFDKDDAVPLANATITFYKDQARNVKKDIFQLSGSPPNYSYVILPNPISLSSIGTFQNGVGDNVIPYFFPYDDEGNIELYYAVVENAGSVLQYSLEGIPNLAEDGDDNIHEIKNYIPNSQFLAHNVIDLTGKTFDEIAQGGWGFERSTSNATDLITFERFDSPVTNPSGYPRYACRIQCTSPHAGETGKIVFVDFRDANKFASDSDNYTFSVTAKTNVGSSLDIPIYWNKYFGTGGSPSSNTQILIGTLNLTDTYQIFNINFIPGTNIGKTFGTNDDDGAFISFNLPLTSTFDISFVNCIFTDGIVDINEFPPTTNATMLANGIAGWMPEPRRNNQDLYLPLRLTPAGLEFSEADIAKVCAAMYETPQIGELFCDGASYDPDLYSSDRIPYSRLGNRLYSATNKRYRFGTGLDFIESLTTTINGEFLAAHNTPGTTTNISDGATGTGHTFTNLHNGTEYDFISYLVGNDFYVRTKTAGASNIDLSYNYFLSDTSSGVSTYNYMYDTETGQAQSTVAVAITGADTLIHGFITEATQPTFLTIAPGYQQLTINANITAGTDNAFIYGKLYKRDTGGTETLIATSTESASLNATNKSYIVSWIISSIETIASTDRLVFKIYGTPFGLGTTPTVTIYMEGSVDSNISGQTTLAGTSGFTPTINVIGNLNQPTTASFNIPSLTGIVGKYFWISNTTTDYYVWFTVDGSGSDPSPGGTGIQVKLASTDTIADAAYIISRTLSGFHLTRINTVAGASLSGSEYFEFTTPTSKDYAVWCTVDGSGSAPSGTFDKKIQVDVLSTDTVEQVAEKTIEALNAALYATPYLRGIFLRGWADGDLVADPDANDRISDHGGPAGDNVGSFEWWRIQSHVHEFTAAYPGSKSVGPGDTDFETLYTPSDTNATGGNQTNPLSVYVNYVIKY